MSKSKSKPAVPTFADVEFTATQWASAEDKRRWAVKLARFLLNGAPEAQFSDVLYRQLSNMYGHIAHYNRSGFYAVWFACDRKRFAWLLNALEHGGRYGDPAWTWSDVERALCAWLAESGLVQAWYDAACEEAIAARHQAARAALAALTPEEREAFLRVPDMLCREEGS